MKRFKLLPSILMLVLCTAVLAVGIYAVSPTSHSVVGTVKITAGGANVRITAYIDDLDGNYANDVKVSDVYTSRTPQTINIYANALDYDCSSASDITEVAEKELYFKIENLSSYSLGVYFLEGTVPESGTTLSNVAESKNFNGTMGSQTISNLITATFTPYSEVPANGSTKMYSTLKLNQLNSEASAVTLNLNLNIEKFNEELLPRLDNVVEIKNANKLNIFVSGEVKNANTDSSCIISKAGVWEIGELKFSDERIAGQLRLPRIDITITITNNNNFPISATLVEGKYNVAQDYAIVVLPINNPYIAPGKTGVVSLQFIIDVYDSSFEIERTLNTYNYSVEIKKIENDESVLSRVLYDNDTSTGSMPSKGFYYYVELGNNPYYKAGSTQHRQKLRWYICG